MGCRKTKGYHSKLQFELNIKTGLQNTMGNTIKNEWSTLNKQISRVGEKEDSKPWIKKYTFVNT